MVLRYGDHAITGSGSMNSCTNVSLSLFSTNDDTREIENFYNTISVDDRVNIYLECDKRIPSWRWHNPFAGSLVVLNKGKCFTDRDVCYIMTMSTLSHIAYFNLEYNFIHSDNYKAHKYVGFHNCKAPDTTLSFQPVCVYPSPTCHVYYTICYNIRTVACTLSHTTTTTSSCGMS